MKNLIAGNWKLKGSQNLANSYLNHLSENKPVNCTLLVCPTFDLLEYISEKWSQDFGFLGAQDCYHDDSAFNEGLASVDKVARTGAGYIILGHSDRRHKCQETSGLVRKKVNLAWKHGLLPIVCVGEKSEERKSNLTQEVVKKQIIESIDFDHLHGSFVIAYEPVWAIGSGNIPTMDEIGIVHDGIRTLLIAKIGSHQGKNTPILYGGSADSNNAEQILAVNNVNGLLIGGASLDIRGFGTIINKA